jgi:hypothetical protein
MNNNTKGIIAVLVVGGIAYFIYKRLYNPKRAVLTVINKNFPKNDNDTWIKAQPKEYINAWGKAILKGETTFIYNGNLKCANGFTPKDGKC